MKLSIVDTSPVLAGSTAVEAFQTTVELARFPLTHVKLLRSVWGIEYGGELEYLRTYVHTLRKKIEKVPANPEYIVNEPWIGYRFRCPNDQEPAAVQNR